MDTGATSDTEADILYRGGKFHDALVQQMLTMELDARMRRIMSYAQQAHLHVVLDDDPETITLSLQGSLFSDPRAAFPSIVTMANIELAIAAGQSDRNLPSDMEPDTWRPTQWMDRQAMVYRGGFGLK